MTMAYNRGKTDRRYHSRFQSTCLVLKNETRRLSIQSQASVDPEGIPISMATKTIRNVEILKLIHSSPTEKPP